MTEAVPSQCGFNAVTQSPGAVLQVEEQHGARVLNGVVVQELAPKGQRERPLHGQEALEATLAAGNQHGLLGRQQPVYEKALSDARTGRQFFKCHQRYRRSDIAILWRVVPIPRRSIWPQV